MTGDTPTKARGRLLQVVTSTDRRGAEVFGTQLGHVLAERGWDTRTVALRSGGSSAPLALASLGSRPLAPATLFALRRAAAGTLVVAHGSTTLPACAVATPGVAPFIYRNIGDPAYWAHSASQCVRVGLLLRRARAVIALSESMADVLTRSFGVRRDRIFVIPNAVSATAFPLVDAARRSQARSALGIASTASVVAYVGALSPEKNVGAAVDALASLGGATLVVAGEGPELARLERRAAVMTPGRVRFISSTATPVSVLAAADAFVLPSRTEGMPGVLIEAGFSGIPVVATCVGAVNEVVVHGETGLLVPPGDQLALTEALRSILANPSDMGRRARAFCLERFDLDKVVDDWEEVLRKVA